MGQPVTVLEGVMVDLIPFTTRYRDEIFTYWKGESRVRMSMGQHLILSLAERARFWDVWADVTPNAQHGVPFLLRAKDGHMIGLAALNRTEPTHRVGEIGIEIGDLSYWYRGCGTDTLLLLTAFAFDWLDLRRVVLATMALNGPMRRVAERSGYRLEATQRRGTLIRGTWTDILHYGVLRAEWPGRAALVEQCDLHAKAARAYGKG